MFWYYASELTHMSCDIYGIFTLFLMSGKNHLISDMIVIRAFDRMSHLTDLPDMYVLCKPFGLIVAYKAYLSVIVIMDPLAFFVIMPVSFKHILVIIRIYSMDVKERTSLITCIYLEPVSL